MRISIKSKFFALKKQLIQNCVLTEKHPVLLGVRPAPLLNGKAHVDLSLCLCSVSTISPRIRASGAGRGDKTPLRQMSSHAQCSSRG